MYQYETRHALIIILIDLIIVAGKIKVYFGWYVDSNVFTLNEFNSFWDENTISWYNKPENNPIALDTFFLRAYGSILAEFDVTNLVNEWVTGEKANYGFLLKSFQEKYPYQVHSCLYTSDYSDPTLRPILEITCLGLPDTLITTGIANNKDINESKDYYLDQNYPNPFNPGTTIKFVLSKAAHVTLNIYNSWDRKFQD